MDAQAAAVEVPLYSPPPHNGNGKAEGTPGPKSYGGQNWLIWLCLRYRVVVACLGRRWGKTEGCMRLLLEKASRKKGHYRAGYGTPTARLARRRYDEFLGMFTRAGFKVTHNRQDLVLTIENAINGCTGMTLFFWGLEEPDNIRGEALDDLILDECKDILGRAYFSVLRAMLIDTNGFVLLMGTPSRIGKGSAWYRKLFLIAKGGKNPDYAWLSGPTHDNPNLTPESIAAAISDVESEGGSVEEEIYARWLSDQGAVFECLPQTFSVPVLREEGKDLWIGEDVDTGIAAIDHLHPGREPDQYIIGFDIALLRDFSVAAVFNRRTRDMAALLRMHRTPDHVQQDRLMELHLRYNHATILYDRNGLGLGWMGEMGRRFGKYGVPVVWTAQEKIADIRRASMLCQKAGGGPAVASESWALLNVAWLYAEFEAYTVQTHDAQEKPLAVPKYGAPPGLHDDGVAACAMAARWLMTAQSVVETTKEPAMFSGQWAIDRLEKRRLYR